MRLLKKLLNGLNHWVIWHYVDETRVQPIKAMELWEPSNVSL
jgi:hypothetical protein